MNKKTKLIFLALVLLFILVRLPGISLPYHQDEWKNVSASANTTDAGLFFAHPPLMQMLFVGGSNLFGEDCFRFVPLIFSLFALALLYLVVCKRFSSRVALWSVFLATICFYNIWGSLMVDVDGAILPFLFLLSVYFYDRSSFTWLGLTLFIGCLIKLSFFLVVGTFLLDYLITHGKGEKLKMFGKVVGVGVTFSLIYVALLYLIQWLYPAFSISFMLGHANQFTEEVGRNYTQIIVQTIKAIYYLSPLSLLIFWSSREVFSKTRLFWIYLVSGLIFFLILFDFSRGALDKYLVFAVMPLIVIIAPIFAENFLALKNLKRQKIILTGVVTLIIAGALFWLNFLPHNIFPLYPKNFWFSAVLHGQWNFLNPFTGGSGPTGFYVSFLFIVTSFMLSALVIVLGLLKKSFRPLVLVMLLTVSLVYNTVSAEELFFGQINGSASTALASAMQFISAHSEIKKVITYNDIGAHELVKLGKYAGRFYVAPQFEAGHQKFFTAQKDSAQFLVVDLPHLNPESFYGIFFSRCRILFQTSSGQVPAHLYSC